MMDRVDANRCYKNQRCHDRWDFGARARPPFGFLITQYPTTFQQGFMMCPTTISYLPTPLKITIFCEFHAVNVVELKLRIDLLYNISVLCIWNPVILTWLQENKTWFMLRKMHQGKHHGVCLRTDYFRIWMKKKYFPCF